MHYSPSPPKIFTMRHFHFWRRVAGSLAVAWLVCAVWPGMALAAGDPAEPDQAPQPPARKPLRPAPVANPGPIRIEVGNLRGHVELRIGGNLVIQGGVAGALVVNEDGADNSADEPGGVIDLEESSDVEKLINEAERLRGEQRLTDGVVDLVSAGVIEIFTFEVDLRAAELPAQPLGMVERRGTPDELTQFVLELRLKLRIAARSVVEGGEFVEGVHERLGDEASAVLTEMAGDGLFVSVTALHFAPRRRNVESLPCLYAALPGRVPRRRC